MAGWKISKVELNKSNGWKAFNNLRNSDGVIKALKETGEEIGEVKATYKGFSRGHVYIKTDIDTFNNLVAQGKVTPKDKNKEN